MHQAFYGEVNRSHSCIVQTILDSDLTSFLIAFTDRPSALPPGSTLCPYFSGSSFLDYYILTKTFPDLSAPRDGMVFTHVIILSINDIRKINDIEEILINFIDEIPNDRKTLLPRTISLSSTVNSVFTENRVNEFIEKAGQALIKGELPIVFNGQIQSFKILLNYLWNIPILNFRKGIKFRVSFSPSDIEGVKDLTMVTTQNEFLNKWYNKNVIDDNSAKIIDISNPTEALLLRQTDNNTFFDFVNELGIELTDISTLNKCSKLHTSYTKIGKIESTEELRQIIRLLLLLSPSDKNGIEIKNRILHQFELKCQAEFEKLNILALRNINWQIFQNGEVRIINLINNYIKKIFDPKLNNIDRLSEIIVEAYDKSEEVESNSWWYQNIRESIKLIFSKFDDDLVPITWNLGAYDKAFTYIKDFLPNTSNIENSLRKQLPISLKTNVIDNFREKCLDNKWYLLYADIGLKIKSFEQTLIEQLHIEKELQIETSEGVIYLCNKLSDTDLLRHTLKISDTKLIELSVKRIIKNEKLLSTIDLNSSCWKSIWSKVLFKLKNISFGISGREKEIIDSFFDIITLTNDQNQENVIIFQAIVEGGFTNISSYKNRKLLWKWIPISYKSKFIESTSKSIFSDLIDGKMDLENMEEDILNHITSEGSIGVFLYNNRNEIKNVLIAFEKLPNLKDEFLSDYVRNYPKDITEQESIRLGKIIESNQYRKTAQTVYTKSKDYKSFKIASSLNKSLIKKNFWDYLLDNENVTIDLHNSQINNNYMENRNITNLPRIVILTALLEEFNAVREHLSESKEIEINDTIYESGMYKINDTIYAEIILRECGQGNVIAAQETERVIANFNPDYMFFVGIAGSRKPNDFGVGDVIIANKVYSYETGKAEKEAFLARPNLSTVAYEFEEKVKSLRRRDEWKNHIKGGFDTSSVKADLGVIASGEKLIEHYNSWIGGVLTNHYNDTQAVEMEGFGFAKAAERQGGQQANIKIAVIRGISDILEKDEKTQTDKRPENVKKFASATAAACTFALIEKIVSSKKNS